MAFEASTVARSARRVIFLTSLLPSLTASFARSEGVAHIWYHASPTSPASHSVILIIMSSQWIVDLRRATDAEASSEPPGELAALYKTALFALCRYLDAHPEIPDGELGLCRERRDQCAKRLRRLWTELRNGGASGGGAPRREIRPVAAGKNGGATNGGVGAHVESGFEFETFAPDENLWNAVVGNEKAKRELLASSIFNPNPDQPCMILLCGPPGTGKTMMVKAIAALTHRPFAAVQSADLLVRFYGESEVSVVEFFKAARAKRAVVMMDEIEALFGDRDGSDRTMSRVQSALLTNILQPGVLLVGITNLDHKLDSAFVSRFSAVVRVELPDAAEMRVILERRCPFPIDDDLMDAATGRSGRDVDTVVTSAERDRWVDIMRRGTFHETPGGRFAPCDGSDGCPPLSSLLAPRPPQRLIDAPPMLSSDVARRLRAKPKGKGAVASVVAAAVPVGDLLELS